MGGEVKNMRGALLAVSVLVLVAGCGSPGPVAAGNYKLYEAASARTGQLVAVIDTQSRATERRLPWGIPSTDGKHFYSVSGKTLQDIDPHSGTVLRTLQLPGSYEMPPATLGGAPGGLSQNGRYLVLQMAGQATASHMLLIDTQLFNVAKRIDLNGKFEFDAVNNTGQGVYVIEYPNAADSYYHVRVYEVLAGRLGAYTVVDKGGPNEVMTGVRLSGVFSPDGQWLYSLYARADKGAFVHALNLNGPWAFCLDLPGSGYSSNMNAFQWSLAITPDGRHVYAANAPMGLVTRIDNLDGGQPAIKRNGRIASTGSAAIPFVQNVAAKEMGPHGAVVSNDGKTLVTADTNGLIWMDTGTLQVRNRMLSSWSVWSLAASPDGTTIYGLSDTGAIAELSMASARVIATFDVAEGFPMGLLRVEPA
jgi:hypothetical protein